MVVVFFLSLLIVIFESFFSLIVCRESNWTVQYHTCVDEIVSSLSLIGFSRYACRVLPRNQIHWDKWPTGFEKVGHFRKYRALVNFPYATNGWSALRQVGKTEGLLDYSKSVHSNTLFWKLKMSWVNCKITHSKSFLWSLLAWRKSVLVLPLVQRPLVILYVFLFFKFFKHSLTLLLNFLVLYGTVVQRFFITADIMQYADFQGWCSIARVICNWPGHTRIWSFIWLTLFYTKMVEKFIMS